MLNHAIAVAMVSGPPAGLELVGLEDGRWRGHHRLAAVRAHLLELAGDREAAIAEYGIAAGRTGSLPERNYLDDAGGEIARGVSCVGLHRAKVREAFARLAQAGGIRP